MNWKGKKNKEKKKKARPKRRTGRRAGGNEVKKFGERTENLLSPMGEGRERESRRKETKVTVWRSHRRESPA